MSIVPNAPCGVERPNISFQPYLCHGFLMHRVELKAKSYMNSYFKLSSVPNAPCGVERRDKGEPHQFHQSLVPNAPCGVESRVERLEGCGCSSVPNAPCGVESRQR